MKTLSDDGQSNFNVCVAILIVATLSVSLRFAIKIFAKLSVTAADYLCLLALLLFVGYVAVLMHYIIDGPGRGELNLMTLTVRKAFLQIIYLLKILFVTEILFTLVITVIKISILLLYYNIFHISSKFRWAVKIAGALCIIWGIIMTFLIIFQCNPVAALWDKMAAPQFCMSTSKLLLGYEITNLFLDVLVLCLPLGMLRTLQLPGYRKASVGGMFLLGGFVCIASIMRLTYIWIPGHTEAPNLPLVMVWSTIQLGIAILCSCLPTYAPLFRKAKPALRTLTATFQNSSQKSSSRGTRGSTSNGTVTNSSSYYKNLDKPGAASVSGASADREDYPLAPMNSSNPPISKPIVDENGDYRYSQDDRIGSPARVQQFAGGGRNHGW
ncbi:hypothetical protein FQN54_009896 [Arachnomyces sp. PD_36]|nr:hypothetical protein FQN54_009896 [Arachnomyces sp. PD_36]